MKFISLLLPAMVSAAVLEARQGKIGTAKVGGITQLKPVVNPRATRQITRFGPISVKGKSAGAKDSGEQNWLLTIRDGLCKNCTVLKGKVGLVNADGSPANPQTGIYIHHILTYDTKKKQKGFISGCGVGGAASAMGSKFIGTGEDNNNIDVWYTSKQGDATGGFHIGPTDTFSMNADLVSYADSVRDVYITMDIEYLNGIVGGDAREVLLSVTGCGNNAIKLSESGPTTTKSPTFTFTDNGFLIGAKGHLHSGGERMVMYINGKVVCESVANYGSKGNNAIAGMSTCFDKPLAVRTGDKLEFEAHYDVSKHPIRKSTGSMPDVMGMFNLYFS